MSFFSACWLPAEPLECAGVGNSLDLGEQTEVSLGAILL